MKRLLNEKSMVRLAWIQAFLSIPCLIIFPFLTTQKQILLLGLVTMITWTATALAHISAARANLEIVTDKADVDANEVNIN